jgi:hypothetical protein
MTVDAPHWKYGVRVNIPAAACLIDEMLISAGVDIYYNQAAVDVETEESGNTDIPIKVKSVIITTKSGLKRIDGKIFIDCTGDGDISVWAGAEYECGDTDRALQPGTIRYYFENMSLNNAEAIMKNIQEAEKAGELKPQDTFKRNITHLFNENGNNSNHISGYNGADSDSKTQAEIEGHKCVYRIMKILGDNLKITTIAPEVAMRETRRIICDSYITADDYVNAKEYPDSICNSFYPIDLHRSGMGGIYQVFLTDGQVPKIPLSALMVKGITNLYVAGRCASGDRLANSAYRVKASCMAMGQAVGAAAAVSTKENNGFTRGCSLVNIKKILIDNGAIVP